MLFNSIAFLIFFPTVVLMYWLLPDRWRNPMLLVASYYFYMNWEPVYALLILLSTVTTWGCALLMIRDHKLRRLWLTLCLTLNLGILILYKYAGFIAQSVHGALAALGIAMPVPEFTLLLPVGISFYTFQAIGYTVDVYRGHLSPERNLFTYALFVSFFPQLVAGPIERASNLLPQFHTIHRFNPEMVRTGLRMMMWGYFMKLCIADAVAPYVDAVFDNLPQHTGKSVWLAAIFFTFQIFCDFGGYSLIAIGTSRCLGFMLMDNFRQPYLARDVRDFWHRWHISLSSWFSDYLYKTLSGSRCSTFKHQRNLFLTFLLSGLWHGANWTFVAWGAYHGIFQILLSLKRKFIPRKKTQTRLVTALLMLMTFLISVIGWVLFRANTLDDAQLAFTKMLNPWGSYYVGTGKRSLLLCLLMIIILMAREIRNERHIDFRLTSHDNVWISGISTGLLLVLILLCAQFNSQQFIYFQF